MNNLELEYRMAHLKRMDDYVKNIINDDDIIVYVWFVYGLPNGYDEIDLKEIALDDELYLDCVKCFNKCCKLGTK